MQRRPRQHDGQHLAWIRTLPCCICGDNTSTEAAHIRMSDARIGKPLTGIAVKPDDCFVLPLCGTHHREQHQMSEFGFWHYRNIDPVLLALRLYSLSGDAEEAEHIISVPHTK